VLNDTIFVSIVFQSNVFEIFKSEVDGTIVVSGNLTHPTEIIVINKKATCFKVMDFIAVKIINSNSYTYFWNNYRTSQF
jgi:hypothetical protein